MVVDIVCGALLLIFGLFGVFKGFARQIFKFASFFAAVIGAFLLVKPAFDFCYALGFGKIGTKRWQARSTPTAGSAR